MPSARRTRWPWATATTLQATPCSSTCATIPTASLAARAPAAWPTATPSHRSGALRHRWARPSARPRCTTASANTAWPRCAPQAAAMPKWRCATPRATARSRPPPFATLGADPRVAGWTVGAEVQASGRRFDTVANTNVLGGYTLVNLYASTRIARDYTLLARIDNLADKDYQLARTYATAGRTVYVGVKWAPQ